MNNSLEQKFPTLGLLSQVSNHFCKAQAGPEKNQLFLNTQTNFLIFAVKQRDGGGFHFPTGPTTPLVIHGVTKKFRTLRTKGQRTKEEKGWKHLQA